MPVLTLIVESGSFGTVLVPWGPMRGTTREVVSCTSWGVENSRSCSKVTSSSISSAIASKR